MIAARCKSGADVGVANGVGTRVVAGSDVSSTGTEEDVQAITISRKTVTATKIINALTRAGQRCWRLPGISNATLRRGQAPFLLGQPYL